MTEILFARNQDVTNAVTSVVSDINVTGAIASNVLTLGWSGTLAAGRLNANVVQTLTNDTNIQGAISAQNLTFSWAGTLALTRLVNGTNGQMLMAGASNPQYSTATWPTTVSGANQALVSTGANAWGATGTPTLTSIAFSPTTGGVVGTTTNDNAGAGFVGEFISANVAFGSAISIVNNTAKNITSISLTAGDWDVSGLIGAAPAGTTVVSFFSGGISVTANTLPSFGGTGTGDTRNDTWNNGNMVAGDVPPTCILGPTRYSLSGTTTVNLIVFCSFATSTCTAYGYIRARRIR